MHKIYKVTRNEQHYGSLTQNEKQASTGHPERSGWRFADLGTVQFQFQFQFQFRVAQHR